MSVLERRLQILLASDQYSQVEREARRSGSSVAGVIRAAIAQYLDSHSPARAQAADRLLASADDETATGTAWEVAKAEIDADLAGRVP